MNRKALIIIPKCPIFFVESQSSIFDCKIWLSDNTQFWLNGLVSKQNCRIRSEAYMQQVLKGAIHPGKCTVFSFILAPLISLKIKSKLALQSMAIIAAS